MKKNNFEYLPSDGWLLQAIIYAFKNGPGDLRSVIACGDAINHAIFNMDEVESGLYKLSEGGYIRPENDRFVPTEKTLAEYEKISKRNISPIEEMKLINQFLKVAFTNLSTSPVPYLEDRFKYPGFTRELFEEAVNKYLKR